MASIDEKLLDGPSVGYCSSSDEEYEGGGTAVVGGVMQSSLAESQQSKNVNTSDGTPRTGPKGVLADFERFRQENLTRAALDEAKFLQVANRFSLSHKPTTDGTESGDEDELERIRSRRVEQLKNLARGRIVEVPSRLDFLSLIENESCNGALLFIHIYSDGHEQSNQLNDALLELAGRLGGAARPTKAVKFYKVQAKVLGTSENFTLNALPTLQVYSDEQLIGNFIRMSAELGDDYDGAELYKFLRGHGIPLKLDAKC
ncbi:hypothetical protein niasHT_014075 [Heterodera trifolii]|uniref:Phosducin domain-containing protein n=1 Tax=Heterodera trifolii TaxID=157864 RepID=A0ABD2LG99_9BILA